MANGSSKVSLVAACAIAMLAARSAYAQSAPPNAPIRPDTDDFDTKVVDNYRYFENLRDPEVQQWMKAQADDTRATLDALPGYPALLARITELDASEPVHVSQLQIVAGRYYSLRRPAGSQSSKLYVRDDVHGEDHLLIDPATLGADQHAHLTIDGYAPSPDGRYVAYGIAAGGSEQRTLHILDVRLGRDLPETGDRIRGNPVWRADGRSFFYSRQQKLTADMSSTQENDNPRDYLHVLGRAFDDDPPIVGRGVSDEAFSLAPTEFADVMTAPRSRYAIAFVFAGTDSRMRVYAAPVDSVRDRHTAWRPIAPSYDDQYIGGDAAEVASIALTADTLYWLSRKDAPRSKRAHSYMALGSASANSTRKSAICRHTASKYTRPFSAVALPGFPTPVSSVTSVQRRGAHAHPSRSPRTRKRRAVPGPASPSGRTRWGAIAIITLVSSSPA